MSPDASRTGVSNQRSTLSPPAAASRSSSSTASSSRNSALTRPRPGFSKSIVAGDAEAGLEQFLEMLRRDRGFDDGLPKRALIDAFRIIEDEDLVGRYRRKMSSLLLV